MIPNGPDQPARITSARALVALLGGHAADSLGLDLTSPDDPTLGRWLLANCVLGGRAPETTALRACEALAQAGIFDPDKILQQPLRAEECLAAAGIRGADAIAALLVRVSRALRDKHGGSVARLASDADGLEELAGRLAGLASGFGRAAVLRYLTPLRHVWSAASDLPASPAVTAAAAHLSLIDQTVDEEATPSALARSLSATDPDEASASRLALRDLEAALERLGRRSCLRGRTDRCPLRHDCPMKAQGTE